MSRILMNCVTTGTSISAPKLPPEATFPIAKPRYFSNQRDGVVNDKFTMMEEPNPNITPCVGTSCHILVLKEAKRRPTDAMTVPIKMVFLIPSTLIKGLANNPPQSENVRHIVLIHAILSAGSFTNRTLR
ncbi:hypothetical protein AYI70_g3745 [Smittium culicis]|uniref:Uncharacterized protein n=1 Tax=Smittium culicis TaxID=133412 RepID=A0A1R1Y224_9FUNG|nr:hypothetical protein AYI70_g3745 [Smittium culicis]